MFRLALKLGKTVSQLSRELSSKELTEWMAFYSLEPFDDLRADLRAGIISSTIANAHRTKGKAFKPSDFMPYLEKEEENLDEATAIKRMFSSMGAKKQSG